jgi:hypothetical protein
MEGEPSISNCQALSVFVDESCGSKTGENFHPEKPTALLTFECEQGKAEYK